MFKNILALSPHTDDAELGAGGSITKLIDNGAHVHMMAFSWCEHKQNIESLHQSAEILGIQDVTLHDFPRRIFPEKRQDILQILYDYNKNNPKIDLVFVPSTTDLNQDHQVIAQEAMRAFKTTILGYEMPWNNIQFTTNSFIPLEEKHVNTKIQALDKYNTQKNRYYFTEDYFRSILRTRGTQIQKHYAEAFEVIRFVPKI